MWKSLWAIVLKWEWVYEGGCAVGPGGSTFPLISNIIYIPSLGGESSV